MLIHGVVDNDIHPPLFGSSQRVFGLFRGLARRHQVRVLCVVPNRTRAPRTETVAGVSLIRTRRWYTSLAWRLERWGLAPLFTAAYGHRASAGSLLAELPEGADVLCADLNLATLLERSRAPLRIYTSQNVEVDRFAREGGRLFARGAWAMRLKRLEARAVGRSDLVVACSDEDAERLRALYGAMTPVLVAPNGYDETRLRPPTPAERAHAREALGVRDDQYLCVFVGSDYGPNREALRFAVQRMMPKLAKSRIRLLVVGSVSAMLRGRSEPWLIVRDAVPDLLPLLHAADCGVNPVTSGGGSNVKIPTYLAAGLAVVSTPFGLRGYAPLRPLVTLGEPERLADAVASRPTGWGAAGSAAPETLGDYAWGAIGERLGEELAERLAALGRAPAAGAMPGGHEERRMRA